MPAQAQPEGEPSLNEPGGKVNVDENLITELFVNDEDLNTVLQLLGVQAQKNVVTGQSVAGRVTANFYGVTFYEALEAILNVNGYGYIERGNFIYVYGLEELERIQEATRTRRSELVKLNYVSAQDVQIFVEPMLSEKGSITVSPETAPFSLPGDVPTGADSFAAGSTVIVTDYDEEVDAILEMIELIDTRPAQVLVESTILQTSLNEANAFGIDFSIVGDLDFSEFTGSGGPLSVVPSLIGGQGGTLVGGTDTPIATPDDGKGGGVTSTVGNTAGPATFRAGIVSGDFAVFMRMLDEVTDVTILSSPKLLTLNRQPARVLVGRKIGYLSSTTTETSTTQSVQFLDTGTQLYFRPFISNDGFIRMELKPQVSDAEIREVTAVGGSAITIPDEVTNELTTNVMVRDGQTIVLGGLFRESTTVTRRQIPFLGDIPILGHAFRGNDDESIRQEIVFMVKPTVVNDQILLDEADRALATIDNARTGIRKGLLPWSRTKLTAIYNVEAQELIAQGDYKKALFKIQQSLSMNPAQPNVIAMRENLVGQESSWNDSYLDEIISGELESL
ncbi:MAG: type II secretion system protein GspD, partial [Phycisphaerales bacterium JB058]